MKWRVYPSYKDSGIEWLGNIPTHWEKNKVKYIADYLNGHAFKPSDWSDQGKEIIRIENLTNSEARANRFQGELDRQYLVRRGDILLSWSASLGVYVWDREDGWLNQHIFKVTPNPDVVAKSFYLWLSKWFIIELQKECHGSTMKHLTKDKFGRFVVYLPPFPEQQLIAAFLDFEAKRIEALITKKERHIELLLEKSAALISNAVTKGLNPNVPMKDSGFELVGEIPAHWTLVRSKAIFYEVDERSESGDEELLTVSHITGVTPRSEIEVNMFLPETFEGYKKCKSGDLVINTMWAWMGALGISEYDGIVSPSYNVYRFREKDEFVPKYLDLLYRSPPYVCEIGRHSKGIWKSRLRLYPDSFFEIYSLKPPVSEQREIVDHVTREVLLLDNLIEKLWKSIGNLEEYRNTLISAAVTGKIDVRN